MKLFTPQILPPQVGLPPDTIIGALSDTLATLWHRPPTLWNKIHKDMNLRGQGVKVAVLDTGYAKHQYGPKIVAEKSFINGQSVVDGHGHGTHCIGIVAGQITPDGTHIGAAPDAEILVGKVLSNGGSGGSDGITNGILWAIDNGADIISMSLGGGGEYTPTSRAIDKAIAAGVWVVIAAGNAGYNGANTISWPGKYKNCLCTGAYQENGTIANFSSGGAEIDWACAGQNIVSLSNNGTAYRTMSGTSMATPDGAGYLAIVRQVLREQGFAAWQSIEAIKEFFKANMKDAGAPGFDVRFGDGIPVIDELVKALDNEQLTYV